MPLLLQIALGFAGGCLLGAWIPGRILLSAITLGGLTLFCFLLRKKRSFPEGLLILTAGALAGLLYMGAFQTIRLRPLQTFHGQVLPMEITLTDYRNPRETYDTVDGRAELMGKSCRVRVSLSKGQELQPGDRLRGSFQISTVPMGPKFRSGHPGDGIFLTAKPEGKIRILPGNSGDFQYLPQRLARYTRETISLCFSEKAAGFARALFLGDKDGLDFETKWDLRTSGIAHLTAVSGLHVSVLCVLISLVCFKNPWLTAILGIPVLLLFSAMTGFSPSVVRASVMMGLLILSHLFCRRYDPKAELGAALLGMLLINPYSVLSVSLQLSCLSVLGIFCCYGKIRRKFFHWWNLSEDPQGEGKHSRLLLWIADSFSISLSSLLFVAPLSCLYFGSVSLIAPLTNLLVVFLVLPVFWGILMVPVLRFFSLSLAKFLAGILEIPMAYILGTASFLADFPLAAVFPGKLPMLYCVLSLLFFGLRWLFRKKTDTKKFLRTAVLGFLAALILSWGLPRLDHVRMTVLDIGQGQCILLQCRGKNYMVDCGGDRKEDAALTAAEELLSQGIFRLDGLILTHFDRDHVGGAEDLLTVLDTDRIYVPEGSLLPPDPRIRVVREQTDLSLPGGFLTLYPGDPQGEENEKSLCVLLDSKEYDILITGDRSRKGELSLMESYALPEVDCLVAGHHGARDSTSPELLNRVKPRTVVISAGLHNPYGHPAGETLERIYAFGCQILRTDLNGTIRIRR